MRKLYFFSTSIILLSFFALGASYFNKDTGVTVTDQERVKYEEMLNNHEFNRRFTTQELEGIPKADRPDLAFEQNYLATMDPSTGKPETERLFPIFRMTENMQNSVSRTPGSVTTPWVERGPNNVGGRTRALAWDPTLTNKVWAGGVSGGLWYNTNITSSTSSWQSVDDFWDNISVTAIVFDPNNNNTIYVATGESYASANRGAGIWKSTNGGTTWSQLSSTSTFYYIDDMVVRNEAGTSVIYAGVARRYYKGVWHGSNAGLQRSTNGGVSWTQVMPLVSGSSLRPTDLDIAADNKLWVGTDDNAYGNGGGRVYSTSNGTTFSLKYTHSNRGRVALACAPSNSNYVYALFESGSQLDAVKKTTNGGTTWTTQTEPNDVDNGIPATDFTRGQAWYDLIIDVDPLNANTLMVGGIDLFRSTNGASSWTQISKWSNNNNLANLNVSVVHADQHAIVYRPGSSSRVIFGNDGGIAYSSNANLSTPTINHRNKDYNVTQYYACAINPTSGSNNFIAGAQDNGTQKYTAAGVNSTTDVYGGDGAYCHIDQTNGNYQTVAYVYNVIGHSTNKNVSNSNILYDQNTGSFINPSDLDDNMNILYTYKTQTSLYRITGIQGNNPSASTLSISTLQSTATCLKVSPYTTTSTTLFVGTSGGRLFKITNANGTPTKTAITGSSFPTGSISCIEFGQNENQIIVTFSNYGVNSVWYTSNGGTSWASKEGSLPDMPVRWALFNPLNYNEVILATEVGVWSSSDFNTTTPTWTASNSGLANVRVDMLQTRTSDNEVIAATHGRGLFSSSGFTATSNPSYCAATASSNPCDEYISNVTIGTINNTTTCGNYSDYTNLSANVSAGTSVPMTISTALVGGTNAGYTDDQVAVWVDWNNDLDFTDAGEAVYSVTYSATTTFPLSFNIAVPSGLSTSNVRMRVRMSYFPVDGQITPCGTSTWGEVEDYTLNIAGVTPVYCTATSTSNPCDEYISNVTIGTINSTSTCGNYTDNTSFSTNVNAGATVPMTISTAVVGGTSSGYTNDQVAVWVDWNNDQDFTDFGEDVYLVTFGASTSFPLSFNVAVPSGATQGSVRMRVRMSYFTVDGQITPCGSSSWGEVEDYTLNVQPASQISWVSRPSNVNIECDDPSGSSATGTPVASTTCLAGNISISQSDNIVVGSCANSSVITRTWTASDGCGNNKSYNQIITINDNTKPTITCPSAQNLLSTNGSTATIPDFTGLASASDNCSSTGNIVITQVPTVGTSVLLGNTTVTLKATDECGNNESCTFSLNVKIVDGVEEFSAKDIIVYPSPNNGVFNVELGDLAKKVETLKVLNVIGKVVFENNTVNGNSLQKIELPNVSSGVYFVEIKTANETFIKRFMKQ